MSDTPRTIYAIQRRDTKQFWNAGQWTAEPEWIEDYERVEEIHRANRETPLALSTRRVTSENDE
jgi:hypothetical protein